GNVSPMAATKVISTDIPEPQVFITPIFDVNTTETTVDRILDLQTTILPVETETIKERTEIIKYKVIAGDTIFGIADKFGLQPETVLWSNIYTLGDSPDGISIGVELIILPIDGLVYIWTETDGLNGVSGYFQVTPEDIINYPLNELDPETIGDWSLPNIPVGKMLVVPGGRRPTVSWVVARTNEAAGNSYLGPGACSGTIYGAVGTGSYVFPTDSHALSGYDYNPPVHNGLDFEGRSGFNIYAVDTGVIVYSGWSDRGYGNLVVVDHDDGVQSMYAHLLDGSFLPCGSNVYQGEVIGLMGSTGKSTGPHLHFELRFGGSAVNPWYYLQ
ncbi:MAG: LysM peptidoglycan-binding domain-containing M23 family metallopeptidase, partial [Anaerolineaceae bacterium]|nr:LysM peptidoglycan-binding domain-containing M23 family metallopeptidase [Anaerolineaceae bacterium]